MRKKQNTKTVEFANLTEDHKAEFIHFLIKNNICFQEGKENCTAQVSIKPNKSLTQKPLKQKNVQMPAVQPKTSKLEKDMHSKTIKVQKQSGSDHVFKQLKTPTKERKRELGVSSLSCKGRNSTIKKQANQTPRSVNKPSNKHKNNTGQVKEYDSKDITSSSKIYMEQEKIVTKNSKQNITEKERDIAEKTGQKAQRKIEIQRDRVGNKYANLFDLGEKGRAIRWPINLLQRAIEEIYDDIFTKNTQCLQNKNIGTAIKTLTLTSFSQLVQGYFRKKFKGSKLTATNLNNMLFSLSYYITRENCPIVVKTFQDFLVARLHHQDLLYYLFARSILKKELRVTQKLRDSCRSMQGSYFIEGLKARDISRYLRGIIGKDSDLLNQYKNLILTKMQGDQINAYYFLRILLEDYHAKRLSNRSNDFTNGDSFGNTIFEADCSYQHNQHRNTEELTFGEEPECSYEQQREFQYADFWNCQSHSRISDNLYDLIIEKMEKKVVELIQILINDTDHHHETITQLQNLLLRKSESMVTAIFEMNKMKWFKELNISSPSEEDMNFVEGVQIRLRELRENPTGKDIGEFCKNILTTKALVNELQLSLMINN